MMYKSDTNWEIFILELQGEPFSYIGVQWAVSPKRCYGSYYIIGEVYPTQLASLLNGIKDAKIAVLYKRGLKFTKFFDSQKEGE